MPPKGRGAPKPVEFQVTRLQAGRKTWLPGASGLPVALHVPGGGARSTPRREVVVVGKALFGRERFAFEVQEVDYSPVAVRRLLKKEKELSDARFGSGGGLFGFGGLGGEDSDSDDVPRRERGGPLGFIDAYKAKELAPKHSVQVKFQDIDRVETSGDAVTLFLSKAPQCYVKPAGEPRTVNMEVSRDITGGAKTITFLAGAPPSAGLFGRGAEPKAVSFSEVRRLLAQESPRLAALLLGLPPPPLAAAAVGEMATPGRKRKRSGGPGGGSGGGGGSATKQPRPGGRLFLEGIAAADGTWLQKSVERFGLRGSLDATVSEGQWEAYFRERLLLELGEAAALRDDEGDSGSEGHESVFAGATWPRELGPKPEVPRMCYESYRDGPEERRMAAEIIGEIRASVRATVASSSLRLEPDAVARGVFLCSYHINDADEGEPRTVNASARIFAPNGSGHFVDLEYENHQRARMSFTERFSYLYASRGGPGIPRPPPPSGRGKGDGPEKIFELDFDEGRRKNPTRTTLASHAALASLGAHLFGAEGAMSNRKVFGLLVRAAGLGKFGEHNGWPIARARRRFKCGAGEGETDTEPIHGDKCEDASVGGCCVM